MLAIASWFATHVVEFALLILASTQIVVEADGFILGGTAVAALELFRYWVASDLALFLGGIILLEDPFALVSLARAFSIALAFPSCNRKEEIHHFGVVRQALERIVQRQRAVRAGLERTIVLSGHLYKGLSICSEDLRS